MKVIVPTFKARVMTRLPVVTGNGTAPPGSIIELAYGVALQGYAQGVIGAFENAEVVHVQALEHLMQYGADGWFPANLQTIDHVMKAINKADGEAQQPQTVKH